MKSIFKRRDMPYLLAVMSVGLVAIVLYLFPWLFVRGAFAMLLGCVFLSTWAGGWKVGTLAIGLSAGLSAYKMPPSDSMLIGSPEDWVRLVIFAVVAALIAGLHASRSSAVEASRVSEERLKAALSAARMGAWDKNLTTGEFWASAGIEEIFGRRPGSFMSTYDEFLVYIHPDDRSFVSNAFTRSATQGTEFEIEHRIVRPDKGVRWLITRGRIVYDNSGNPERLIAVAVDVTDRYESDLFNEAMANSEAARPGRL